MMQTKDYNHFSDPASWSDNLMPYQHAILTCLTDTLALSPKAWRRNIVDIGCGNGLLASHLAKNLDCNITGIDSVVPPGRTNYIHIHEQSVLRLTASSEQRFSISMSIDMLEHLEPELSLQAAHNIFNSTDNCVIIGVPYREPLSLSYLQCVKCESYFHSVGHVQSFSLESVARLVPTDWQISHAIITGDYWPRILVSESNYIIQNGLSHLSGHHLCPRCGTQNSPTNEQIDQANSYLLNPPQRNHYPWEEPYPYGTEILVFCIKKCANQTKFAIPNSQSITRRAPSFVSLKELPVKACLSRYPTSISVISTNSSNLIIQGPKQFGVMNTKALLNPSSWRKKTIIQKSSYSSSLYGHTLTLQSAQSNRMQLLIGRFYCYKQNVYYQLKTESFAFPVLWNPPSTTFSYSAFSL